MPNTLLFSSSAFLKQPVKAASVAAVPAAVCSLAESAPESKSYNWVTRRWEDFKPLR